MYHEFSAFYALTHIGFQPLGVEGELIVRGGGKKNKMGGGGNKIERGGIKEGGRINRGE